MLLGTLIARPSVAAEPAAVNAWQVTPDVYVLTWNGVNIALEVGEDGPVLVNTGPREAATAVLHEIRNLTREPVRFIIDTSADPWLVGGNATISAAGQSLMIGWNVLRQFNNDPGSITDRLLDTRAPVVARQAALGEIAAQTGVQGQDYQLALPSETFTRPQYSFRINGQGVQVVRLPNAHTDADAAVLFRRSDVVVTGAVFDDTRFPVIDLQHGGSIRGELAAINQLINSLVIPAEPLVKDGGTAVIPVRGPVCDESELVTYRDMLWAITQRVQDMIDRRLSLRAVEAAHPTEDFDSAMERPAATGPPRTSLQRCTAACRPTGKALMVQGRSRRDWRAREANPERSPGRPGGPVVHSRRAGVCTAEQRRHGGPRTGALRSDRLLGLDRDTGLDLPHDRAPAGCLPGHSNQREGAGVCRCVDGCAG
jgi:glyoxylase-like metal-dependent hydrolase (beta-lactamase superfamily II)